MLTKNGKTEIRVYGGLNEIGGNLIEVRYGSNRIILDLGYSFKKFKSLYEWPTRIPQGIDEMIRTGLAPKIDGLYTRWLENGSTPDLEYGKDTDIVGVLLSHAHFDHVGLLPQVNRNIDVYIGDTAKTIVETRIESSITRKYNDYKHIKMKTFRTNTIIDLEYFKVTPVHVDHSIPGSYGYIIETPDTNIVYTGDYRLHGQERSLTFDLIEKAREYNIDFLITEGTRVHDIEDITEKEVYSKLYKIFSRVVKPIFMETSYLDIDRIRSIFRAAEESNKRIIMSGKHFLYVYILAKHDPKLDIHIDKDIISITSMRKRKIFREFENKILREGYEIADKRELPIKEDHVYLDFSEYIQNILKKNIPRGSLAIFSNSEPFDEESYIDFNKIINWLDLFSIPSYRIHSSGHAGPLDIKRFVDETKPKDIIVVHSEHPDTLKKFLLK